MEVTKISQVVNEEFADHIKIAELMREVEPYMQVAEKVRVIYRKLQETMYFHEMGDAFGSGSTEGLIKYHSFSDTVELYMEWLNDRMDSRRDSLRDVMEGEK